MCISAGWWIGERASLFGMLFLEDIPVLAGYCDIFGVLESKMVEV